jgi:hypothetical protein
MSLFTQKELSKYSLTKALSEISSGVQPGCDGTVTGLEAEASEALKAQVRRLTGSEPIGLQVPIAALASLKAINVNNALSGGFLVGQDLEAIVPALRSASVVLALGAQTFTNLKGDLGLPAETAFQSVSRLSDSEALPDVEERSDLRIFPVSRIE